MKVKARAPRILDVAVPSPAKAPAPQPGDTHPLQTLQRTVGNLAVTELIQRDPGGEGEAARTIEGPFGELTTYRQVAALVEYFSKQMKKRSTDLKDKGVVIPADVLAVVRDGLDLADMLEGGEDEPLDESLRKDYFAWEDRFTAADQSLQEAENAQAAKGVKAIEKKARTLMDKLRKELVPVLREGQRKAFRAGDESMLAELADAAHSATETIASLSGVAEKAAAVASDLMTAYDMPTFGKGMGTVSSAIEKVGGVLEKANDAYDKLKLLAGAIEVLAGSSITEAEGDRKAVGFAVEAGTSLLGAVKGADAVFGHIGPMTEACLKGIGKIEDLKSEQNREIMGTEFEGLVDWTVEPGGYDMYEYMTKVMKSKNVSAVPAPPDEVAEYLLDHRDAFSAGAGAAGGELPTTGIFFKDLDANEITSWVYLNRKTIWAMLYGNMRVPK